MYEDFYYNIENGEEFLRRIGLDPEGFKADKAWLDKIVYNHHRFVPFDNLDIWDRAAEPSLSIPDLYDKIVKRRRGGYCFEMNGHLEAALRTLGYECYSVEIRIVRGRDFMPPYRHRGVIVVIDGKKHFCDVGLGFKFFLQSAVYNEGYNSFGIKADCEDGIVKVYEQKKDGSDNYLLWFKDQPALPVDFINPNFACSQDPGSGFRTRLSMVIMTPEEYRKNLVVDDSGSVLTVKNGSDIISETKLSGDKKELSEVLLKEFGVDYEF